MVKRIFAYMAVFLILLYLFFMYQDKITGVILLAEPLYLIIGVCTVTYLRKKISVSMDVISPIAEKNREIPISVHVCNNSRIPVVHFQLVLQVENTFTGERIKYGESGKVKKGRPQQMKLVLQVQECGNIRISLRQCLIYDLLFTLKAKMKLKEEKQIAIFPECRLIPLEVTEKTRGFLTDAEEYSDRECGEDSAEIYEIRNYQENDSVHKIHWKISAKMDNLMVKEYSRPLGCAVLIWLDLRKTKEKKGKNSFKNYFMKEKTGGRELASAYMLEAAASLSLSLLDKKCVHMVAWYEPDNQVIRKKTIRNERHIYELLERLMYVKQYQRWEEAERLYEDAFKGENFSTVVIFRTDNTVKAGEEEFFIPIEDGKIQWEKILFTV